MAEDGTPAGANPGTAASRSRAAIPPNERVIEL